MGDYRLWMNESAFGKKTRQNIRTIDALTFSAGQRATLALPRVGYLARLHWHFNGTATVTLGGGTATLDGLGPWNTMNRVRVQANSGTDIFSVSGYGGLLVDEVIAPPGRGYLVAEGQRASALSYATQVYNAPTASGANTWDFGGTIPIAVNDMSELGLVLLQNELASITFGLEFNSSLYSTTASVAPVLVTGAATVTLTGTVTPTIEYFAVPVEPEARPDISWLHQVLETTQPVGAVGDNTIPLIRENVYLGILHHVILNNTPNTTDIDRVRLSVNNSETPYDTLKRGQIQLQRRRNNVDLPLGVWFIDLFNQGFPNAGDERDILNGKRTSELNSVVTIAAAATLGSNASKINTITRQLVRLTAPAVGGA